MLSLFYSEGAFLLSYEDTAFLQSSLYSLVPIQFHLESTLKLHSVLNLP